MKWEMLIQICLFFSANELTHLINPWIIIFKYFRNQRIDFIQKLYWIQSSVYFYNSESLEYLFLWSS